MASSVVIIEDAPITFKSFVWKHFGFPVDTRNGVRVTDKTRTICRHCKKRLPYTTANTTTMQRHLLNHHSMLFKEITCDSEGHGQLKKAPRCNLPSARAAAITRDIGGFIASDMMPFSVVESSGFLRLLNTLEPKYSLPSLGHFSHTVIPNLYKECKTKVVQVLKEAESVALTTDCWTSQGAMSYVTITAHIVNSRWEMVNVALQTGQLLDSHAGEGITEVLLKAVSEWDLERCKHGVAVVTDGSRNMGAAVRGTGLAPHIKCFAHAINSASHAGLGVTRVTHLLGRVRCMAGYFQQSSAAAAALESQQRLLQLPTHTLVVDVCTRWITTLDMLNRYLEQQTAIAAALCSTEFTPHNRIEALDNSDIKDMEDIVKLLNPLKSATTVLSEEKSPTVSLIFPLKSMIEQSMAPKVEDSATVADAKNAILSVISDRYSEDTHNYLLQCTALDPRFRTLPQLDDSQRDIIFLKIHERVRWVLQNQTLKVEKEEMEATAETLQPTRGEKRALGPGLDVMEPTSKKTALEDLLGDAFSAEPGQNIEAQQIRRELELYRGEAPVPLTSCPLKWWKVNCTQFPLLSSLAKAYLSIPATSIPSERVFSYEGDIVIAQRSQLLPENVDMLIFLKKNMAVS